MRFLAVLFLLNLIPAPGYSTTIYVPDDYPTIQKAITASVPLIRNNVIRGNGERAIYAYNQVDATITDNYIEGHESSHGAACAISRGKVLIQNNVFVNNKGDLGGALYLSYCTVRIADNLFAGNEALAGKGEGGAIWNQKSDVAMVNNTIFGNAASTDGGSLGKR